MNVIALISILSLMVVVIALLRVKIYQKITIEHTSPYALETKNQSAEPQTAVLFGYNKYLLCVNFGSDVPVRVTPSQSNVSYIECLAQSSSKPFETRLIRLNGDVMEMSKMIINVHYSDANGNSATIPICVSNYISPMDYVKAKDLANFDLDIPYPIVIDGNTYLDYKLNPNSKISMAIFYNTIEFRKMKLGQYLSIKLFGQSYNSNSRSNIDYVHPLFGV